MKKMKIEKALEPPTRYNQINPGSTARSGNTATPKPAPLACGKVNEIQIHENHHDQGDGHVQPEFTHLKNR
jgi:hypothetical protein